MHTMDQQLEELHQELIEMGAMCEQAINDATIALTTGNTELAHQVMANDTLIDQKEREIERLCLRFMLQNQPVAGDLRKVSSTLKMITDMERIGDQARDIAEISLDSNIRDVHGVGALRKMADATSKMVTDSIDAFVRGDVELAHAVIESDDIVDNYFLQIKKDLATLIQKDIQMVEEGLDLLMVAKYFERIGDHATNIAEWVVFSITGTHGGK